MTVQHRPRPASALPRRATRPGFPPLADPEPQRPPLWLGVLAGYALAILIAAAFGLGWLIGEAATRLILIL